MSPAIPHILSNLPRNNILGRLKAGYCPPFALNEKRSGGQ